MTPHTPASDRTVNHLAKSVLLAESGSPLIVRAVIQLGLASLLFFFIWAAFMTLDEVARASGETVPKSHVQKVQHFGGGTVAAILVREGQTVANQELLLRLDPMLSQSQVDQTVANRNALMTRKIRLQALSDGKEPDFGELREHPVGQNEQRLWWQDANAQKLAGMTFERQQAQTKSELEEMAQARHSLENQRKFLQQEMDLRQGLVDKGLNSKVQFLSLQRRMSEIEGELAQIPFRQRKLQERLQEEVLRMQEQEAKDRQKILDDLANVSRELADLEEVLLRHRNSLKHLEIRSPMAGRVHGLQKHAVGEVIASGDTILEVVPLEQELVAEVKISVKDVGHVVTGQPVILKFTNYDFARYGGLSGVLQNISPTSMLDENKSHYFKGTVALERSYLGKKQGELPILPGMALQADIITGQKSVLEYLLKPIFASSRQALQER